MLRKNQGQAITYYMISSISDTRIYKILRYVATSMEKCFFSFSKNKCIRRYLRLWETGQTGGKNLVNISDKLNKINLANFLINSKFFEAQAKMKIIHGII